MTSGDTGQQPEAGEASPQAPIVSRETEGWGGSLMMDVAGPIVDATDENFLADYFDGLRILPPEAAPVEPEPGP